MAKGRPDSVLEEFGTRVRARRLRLGITQEDLAHDAGVHRTYVGSVERGERNITIRNLVRIARALEVDPGTLVRHIGRFD